MKRFKYVCGIFLLLIGAVLCFYPEIRNSLLEKQTERMIRDFESTYYAGKKKEKENAAEHSLLREECEQYNQRIYKEGQSELKDAWSYEQPAISLDQLEGDAFGYIEIPSMEAKLAIYLGASEQNLKNGVAVMGQTSLPIGGENTNCVIAGHRGYYGSPYLRDIEKVSVGDMVYLTNPWENLTYRVTVIDIIDPSDKEAIMIQEGKDMVTLLTCHPYAANTVEKARYVVYCERYYGSENVENLSDPAAGEEILSSDGQLYQSSEREILMDHMLRRAGQAIISLLLLILVMKAIKIGEKGGRSVVGKK